MSYQCWECLKKPYCECDIEWNLENNSAAPPWFRKKIQDDGMDFKLFTRKLYVAEKIKDHIRKVIRWHAYIEVWIVDKKLYWDDPECGKKYMDHFGYSSGGSGLANKKSTAKMDAIYDYQGTRWF